MNIRQAEFTPSDDVLIGELIDRHLELKLNTELMIGLLRHLEDSHKEDPVTLYAIAHSIGQLDVVYRAISSWEI